MKYYFIYSAGGGAGDWNGIKRVWEKEMPITLKENILLKFGDIFFNHKSATNIIRPQRWKSIKDIRLWLEKNVNDTWINKNAQLLLDSGTAKIVSFIHHNYDIGELTTKDIIELFIEIIEKNNIVEKYVDIIVNSNINYAVTFDIPDPFKVRSDNERVARKRNILEEGNTIELMDIAIRYTNDIYNKLKAKLGEEKAISKVMPVINGKWTQKEYDRFLSKIDFKPKNIAVGAISSERKIKDLELMKFSLSNYDKVHFLGCGRIR